MSGAVVSTQAPGLHSIVARTNYDRGKAHGIAESKAAGMAEGGREFLFMYVAERGWALSQGQRERIASCEDFELIKWWFARAMKAESVDQVFG